MLKSRQAVLATFQSLAEAPHCRVVIYERASRMQASWRDALLRRLLLGEVGLGAFATDGVVK